MEVQACLQAATIAWLAASMFISLDRIRASSLRDVEVVRLFITVVKYALQWLQIRKGLANSSYTGLPESRLETSPQIRM